MKRHLAVAAAFLFLFCLWYGISGAVDKPFLPGPVEVVSALLKLCAEGGLWRHLLASVSRIALALFFSSVPAVILGTAAGRSQRFDSVFSPVVYILHPLPKAAFMPVIMLFFGIGEISKVFLVGFIIFTQMLVTMRDAAKQLPQEYMDIVRSFGGRKTALFRHVMLPGLLPGFFTGLRISLGTAIAVLFFAETFASETGLGFLVVDAWTRISYREMYAAILALSLLGFLLFLMIDLSEHLLCPWKKTPGSREN